MGDSGGGGRVANLLEDPHAREKAQVLGILRGARVCPRCCLRVLGCPSYKLETPVTWEEIDEWRRAVQPESDKDTDQIKVQQQEAETDPNFVCSVCFGLLQLDSSCSSIKSVDLRVSRKGFESEGREDLRVECESGDGKFYDRLMAEATEEIEKQGLPSKGTNFTLQINVPASILLRELALVYWLGGKYPNLSFRHLVDGMDNQCNVKQVFRSIIPKSLGKALGSKRVKETMEQSGDLSVEVRLVTSGIDAEESESHGRIAKSEIKESKRSWNRKRKRGGEAEKERVGNLTETNPAALFKAALNMSKEAFLKTATHPDKESWVVTKPGSLHMSYVRHPLYVAGRYIKRNRGLSQTSWYVGSERVGDSSVEELIVKVLRSRITGEEFKFMSAGREDMDVRMLGDGRPFIVEIKNSVTKALPLDELNDPEFTRPFLKDDVEIRDVSAASKKAVSLLCEGAEEKRKHYKAVIWLSKELSDDDIALINATRELTINQKTPVRVLHRRAPIVRQRKIHHMDIQRIDRHFATIELCTEAGTYIKEFVHGDFGRTYPCIASLLGCDADILQLDVTKVDMDFHPDV